MQPRLQTYNNLIGLYDINDKYKYSKIKLSLISYIKFQYLSTKLTNKNLASILFYEFVTTQHFNFSKNFYLTLRNSWLYYYFEFLINSDLLINQLIKKIDTSYKTISSILVLIMTNFYVNFLNEKLTEKNNLGKIKIDFNFKNKSFFLGKLLTYYFLP